VDARRKGIIKSMITGGGIGVTYFVMFSSYCLAFWYGGKLIREEEYSVGKMLVVSVSCTIWFSLVITVSYGLPVGKHYEFTISFARKGLSSTS